MNRDISRRTFGKLVGAGAALAAMPRCALQAAAAATDAPEIKPILGSWISVLWTDRRHYYWNAACAKFSREQWEQSVKEVADIGIRLIPTRVSDMGQKCCAGKHAR